ncbi:fluoride efflux transporter CrcB [Streptomyces djakartensis]|uniref:Fluoride-specific ion channel FluC n=1 Tax=Streptomyces djakartensis TaxID=68193 RepID=A0ABQ3ACR1_9ACTN|nr:fluoride efflux transporter CrcB [Streptomyces djakartensis]GGY42844.1 putative fluoride ion transporter CrcB 1 [Streptomyces djakartensis]
MTVPEEGLRVPAPARRMPSWRAQAPVVAVVALGGGAGAAARYAASLGWPAPAGGFPWTILWVNIAGCAMIGVFMVLVTEARAVHPLVRPFFGTGVLGGFTTFSTYAVDIRKLIDGGHAATGLAYLAATPLAALTAVWLATGAARRVLKRRQP